MAALRPGRLRRRYAQPRDEMKGPPLLSQPPLWRESRLGLEVAALVRDPIFRGHDVDDASGQPVLLVPGFLAGDGSLGLMTRWLRRTGHHTRKAGMRANVDCSEAVTRRLEARLEQMVRRHGQRVAIIGQSRGGSFARVLAVRRPDLVSGIVGLASPTTRQLAIHPLVKAQVLAVGLAGTLGAPGFFSVRCLMNRCCGSFWDDLEAPFPEDVGYLSLYSRSDGVVDWRACLDPGADRLVEVDASHIGMGTNAIVYGEVADALARYRELDRRRSDQRRRARIRLVKAA
jgi:pimeloyl-ACP methyl ester carboxylesterase